MRGMTPAHGANTVDINERVVETLKKTASNRVASGGPFDKLPSFTIGDCAETLTLALGWFFQSNGAFNGQTDLHESDMEARVQGQALRGVKHVNGLLRDLKKAMPVVVPPTEVAHPPVVSKKEVEEKLAAAKAKGGLSDSQLAELQVHLESVSVPERALSQVLAGDSVSEAYAEVMVRNSLKWFTNWLTTPLFPGGSEGTPLSRYMDGTFTPLDLLWALELGPNMQLSLYSAALKEQMESHACCLLLACFAVICYTVKDRGWLVAAPGKCKPGEAYYIAHQLLCAALPESGLLENRYPAEVVNGVFAKVLAVSNKEVETAYSSCCWTGMSLNNTQMTRLDTGAAAAGTCVSSRAADCRGGFFLRLYKGGWHGSNLIPVGTWREVSTRVLLGPCLGLERLFQRCNETTVEFVVERVDNEAAILLESSLSTVFDGLAPVVSDFDATTAAECLTTVFHHLAVSDGSRADGSRADGSRASHYTNLTDLLWSKGDGSTLSALNTLYSVLKLLDEFYEYAAAGTQNNVQDVMESLTLAYSVLSKAVASGTPPGFSKFSATDMQSEYDTNRDILVQIGMANLSVTDGAARDIDTFLEQSKSFPLPKVKELLQLVKKVNDQVVLPPGDKIGCAGNLVFARHDFEMFPEMSRHSDFDLWSKRCVLLQLRLFTLEFLEKLVLENPAMKKKSVPADELVAYIAGKGYGLLELDRDDSTLFRVLFYRSVDGKMERGDTVPAWGWDYVLERGWSVQLEPMKTRSRGGVQVEVLQTMFTTGQIFDPNQSVQLAIPAVKLAIDTLAKAMLHGALPGFDVNLRGVVRNMASLVMVSKILRNPNSFHANMSKASGQECYKAWKNGHLDQFIKEVMQSGPLAEKLKKAFSVTTTDAEDKTKHQAKRVKTMPMPFAV